MLDEKLVPRPDYRLGKHHLLILLLAFLWLFFGVLPFLAADLGFRFLCSSDWYDRTLIWSWIASIVVGSLWVSILNMTLRVRGTVLAAPPGWTRQLGYVGLVFFFFLPMGGLAGVASVRWSIPMTMAIVAGERTQKEVTVRKVAYSRSSYYVDLE